MVLHQTWMDVSGSRHRLVFTVHCELATGADSGDRLCAQSGQNGVTTGDTCDQGSHFTSPQYTDLLKEAGVRISMDGKNRALDKIFTERLWRTVKYEEVYLHEYNSPGGPPISHEIHWILQL